jgi:hypothetical protein
MMTVHCCGQYGGIVNQRRASNWHQRISVLHEKKREHDANNLSSRMTNWRRQGCMISVDQPHWLDAGLNFCSVALLSTRIRDSSDVNWSLLQLTKSSQFAAHSSECERPKDRSDERPPQESQSFIRVQRDHLQNHTTDRFCLVGWQHRPFQSCTMVLRTGMVPGSCQDGWWSLCSGTSLQALDRRHSVLVLDPTNFAIIVCWKGPQILRAI